MNPLLLLPVLIVAVLVTGTDDYAEEVAQAEQYRADVCAGFMPDYQQIEPDCN